MGGGRGYGKGRDLFQGKSRSAGAGLLSDAYQREYFEQLTSEEVRTRFVRGHPVRYWFKPSGVRNEALDRRVYALAALHARPVPWEVLLRAAPSEQPTPPEPTPVVTPTGAPGPQALKHKAPGRRVRYRFGKR